MKKFPTIYKRATTGKIQVWQMIADGNSYYTVSGQLDGKLTTTKPSFGEPKNVGKANETTAEEQALLEAQSKHEHKLAHGYTKDIEGTDDTGYQEPMRAKQFEDYKDVVVYPLYADDKLNGVRMNARKSGIISRRGKPFNTIPHIEAELKAVFDKYPNAFIDGEGYNEAFKNNLNRLIEVASVAYKPSDLTPELLSESERIVKFYVYDGFGFDGIEQNTPFTFRREALKKLFKGFKYVKVLDYTICETIEEVEALLTKAKEGKREGIILRWLNGGYEFRRSKYLLKYKLFKDSEFRIKEIQEGHGDWAGYAKRVVLWLPKPVIGRDGKEVTDFASNIEGDRAFLKKLLEDKDKVVNMECTVKFQDYSEYHIPQIPYIVCIRNYEG